jgi:hypothetical protein
MWGRDDDEREEAREHLKDAITQQFNGTYGSPGQTWMTSAPGGICARYWRFLQYQMHLRLVAM